MLADRRVAAARTGRTHVGTSGSPIALAERRHGTRDAVESEIQSLEPVAPVGLELLPELRALMERSVEERLERIRSNLAWALESSGQHATDVAAISGVAVGTVRGFFHGRDSSIRHVMLMALATGVTLADAERPVEQFRAVVAARRASKR